ncbi:hypothetical protein BDFB_012872 [Asbolus verrucosus]|uniref:CCHC-type domain-containing protein n=1 Tax=Asbolus verrucosus TaxID=1661398 RepID=A0A482W6V9_ASBVE|nr:hypothetical protein BDFB_012872 [Asbolus verrucosus]
MSFYNRKIVQSLLTRILNTFSQMNPTERRYRSDMIRDIALNRFTLHTKEEISHILRIRVPNNLSDTLDFVLNEERIINERKQFNSKSINSSNKYCSNCHKKGHSVNECYKKHPNRNQVRDYTENSRKIRVNQPTNGNTNFSNRQNKFCRYCKNPGHLIDRCKKREYNNRKFQNQERTNSSVSTSNSSKNQMQKIDLNSQTSTTSVAPVSNL